MVKGMKKREGERERKNEKEEKGEKEKWSIRKINEKEEQVSY